MLISAIIILFLGELVLFGAPFFRVKKADIPQIIDALKVKKESVCIGLGYGNAKLLRFIRKSSEDTELIGVEGGLLPIVIAKILSIGKGIRIKYKSIFYTDLSEATHVYLCVGKKAMKKLEVKIFKECKNGTRIVSLDFKFPNIEPVEHIPLSRDNIILANNIYIYDVKK